MQQRISLMKIATSKLVSGIILCLYDHLVLLSVVKLPHIADSFAYRRVVGGIPPLVELLESPDLKVQRAAAGTLRTLAFKNDENKTQVRYKKKAKQTLMPIGIQNCICFHTNASTWLIFPIMQIVQCNALPTLISMLWLEDAAIHYEAVRR
jgi:hypothetical protein